MKTSMHNAQAVLGPELIKAFKETFRNEKEYNDMVEEAMRTFALLDDEGLSYDEQESYSNDAA